MAETLIDPRLTENRLVDAYLTAEPALVDALIKQADVDPSLRCEIGTTAREIVRDVRADDKSSSTIDDLLLEYGLSTEEGVILMRLAEALIRTPDFATSRSLIRDKIGGAKWSSHAGKSHSFLVNQATNGLRFTAGWVSLTGGVKAQNLIAKLGDTVMESAVERAMGIMGEHFVLGRDIDLALKRAQRSEQDGFTHSYDMLGEAAHTRDDADAYFESYRNAMLKLADRSSNSSDMIKSAGLSVKLSALHPRYEYAKRETCVPDLVARLVELANIAERAGLWLNIDAEEADRLETSLIVFEQLLKEPSLKDWPGLGLVIQAYQRRAVPVIDHVCDLIKSARRKIAVRLVKGAYWDMEIKRAQELGLADYPVFTRKENTDISYMACARKLFAASDIIFPQFATHNAHTASAIAHMAPSGAEYEFQRLHGMGGALHRQLMTRFSVPSRIYAPVGTHKDLLPYLVRRLLENGANSSFVNQLMDDRVEIDDIITDPIDTAESNEDHTHPKIPRPVDILNGERLSAKGIDLTQSDTEEKYRDLSSQHRVYAAQSLVCEQAETIEHVVEARSPQNSDKVIGTLRYANAKIVEGAVKAAKQCNWAETTSPQYRATILRRAADLLEAEMDEYLELCVREAGKTYTDAVAEVREAVDFCRYYADQVERSVVANRAPLGIVACISPWNFPLAIFMGQIVAALAVGNTVIAKPAEQTPLIAARAVELLYRAGVPKPALQMIIGDGAELGNALTRHSEIAGVCFTGSTRTAKKIASNLAETGRASIPLIAETGGLNAMIVDSTALLEQAVQDVVDSAFQSAGQRCSACRVVCVQDEVYEPFVQMLVGSMDELSIGDPADPSTDVGPVIDEAAQTIIEQYCADQQTGGSIIKSCSVQELLPIGTFVAPTLIELSDVTALKREIFGPVLHIVRFKSKNVAALIDQINGLGFGLTMGLHTRLDGRIDEIAATAHVGNLYVNRNQIGAVVGVHPFGGEGLSGTGPKAGGPNYLFGLTQAGNAADLPISKSARLVSAPSNKKRTRTLILEARKAARKWQEMCALDERANLLGLFLGTGLNTLADEDLNVATMTRLPGPTGEDNSLRLFPRDTLLCFGGDAPADLIKQVAKSLISGAAVIAVVPDEQEAKITKLQNVLRSEGLPKNLLTLVSLQEGVALVEEQIDGVLADGATRNAIGPSVCHRSGAILPILSAGDPFERFFHERTLTINTTAAGGNASLLALS